MMFGRLVVELAVAAIVEERPGEIELETHML